MIVWFEFQVRMEKMASMEKTVSREMYFLLSQPMNITESIEYGFFWEDVDYIYMIESAQNYFNNKLNMCVSEKHV